MVGDVPVGGGAPVVVQSMTNTRTDDVEATLGADPGAGRRPARGSCGWPCPTRRALRR